MKVTIAVATDQAAFLDLAREVEHWFGPMAEDPGFQATVAKNIQRGSALCVRRADGPGLLGGLLLSVRPAAYRIGWLVVTNAVRGQGVGRALVAEAVSRMDARTKVIEVVTFGLDHPAAEPSGARAFYERLGFQPCEPALSSPQKGPRQWFRLTLP
ncbi:MAG TPA: GNAT family N-acetyltransferase [Micromonosporaceae bacterium]|nr:GNAT family N-acetyltransferase [Micromonosporaceae bacterium]HCU51761.1 GNAT family N-acetyltransferase [Micromonosporaceae bacterium]